MPGPTFDAVGVVATDMAASLAFYRRVGVAFPEGSENEQHVECPLGSGMRLMLDTEASILGFYPDFDPTPGQRVAFAARLNSSEEVDSLYAELDVEGFGSKPPWDSPWGMRYATVHDPDGTHVDLYAMPVAEE